MAAAEKHYGKTGRSPINRQDEALTQKWESAFFFLTDHRKEMNSMTERKEVNHGRDPPDRHAHE